MRFCNSCQQDLAPERFGARSECKKCAALRTADWRVRNPNHRKDHYQANKARVLAVGAAYKAANQGKMRQDRKKWYESNKQHVLAVAKSYRERHPAVYNEASARYDRVRLAATPEWADLHLIQEFYREARRLTDATGVLHHVDHVVPLNSPLVCGLHVHHNLQVLTGPDNNAKSNRVWPDMFLVYLPNWA